MLEYFARYDKRVYVNIVAVTSCEALVTKLAEASYFLTELCSYDLLYYLVISYSASTVVSFAVIASIFNKAYVFKLNV